MPLVFEAPRHSAGSGVELPHDAVYAGPTGGAVAGERAEVAHAVFPVLCAHGGRGALYRRCVHVGRGQLLGHDATLMGNPRLIEECDLDLRLQLHVQQMEEFQLIFARFRAGTHDFTRESVSRMNLWRWWRPATALGIRNRKPG